MSLAHSDSCDMGFDCTCQDGKKLHDPKYQPKDEEELYGRWIECDGCQDAWCMAHQEHAFECQCPSLDEFIFDE